MVYKNRGGQSREKTMIAAWALVTKFGAKQADVATALGCSQPTIANWIKEVSFRKQIDGLENELRDAHGYIEELHSLLPHLGNDE